MKLVQVFLVGSWIFLSGCNEQNTVIDEVAKNDVNYQPKIMEPNADRKTGNMEIGYRKPGAVVRLVNRAVPQLAVGQVETLLLNFQAGYESGVMQVAVSATQGIEIINPKTTSEFTLSAAATYPLPLNVMAHEAGRHYLNINISVSMPDGQTAVRAMSYVVNAGGVTESGVEQKTIVDQTKESVNGVISLPAEENVY